MKMSKLDGIKIMEFLKIPTISRMNISKIIDGEIPIDCGVSIRVSPKTKNDKWNVYLPSIHGCTDVEEIKRFINENGKYEIFAHKTVKPDVLGSISKLEYTNSIIMEIYNDFNDRKNEIIKNRMIIPINNDKIWVSHLEMSKNDPEDFKNFKKVIMYLKDIPFSQYDMEYVIQDGEVMFTDLTLPDGRENATCRSLIKEFELDER